MSACGTALAMDQQGLARLSLTLMLYPCSLREWPRLGIDDCVMCVLLRRRLYLWPRLSALRESCPVMIVFHFSRTLLPFLLCLSLCYPPCACRRLVRVHCYWLLRLLRKNSLPNPSFPSTRLGCGLQCIHFCRGPCHGLQRVRSLLYFVKWKMLQLTGPATCV